VALHCGRKEKGAIKFNMGDTRRYNDEYGDTRRIKKVKKNKRIIDKYRKVIHNVDSFDDDAFDEYLEHEIKQNKTKIR
jgi:hypothetical protein